MSQPGGAYKVAYVHHISYLLNLIAPLFFKTLFRICFTLRSRSRHHDTKGGLIQDLTFCSASGCAGLWYKCRWPSDTLTSAFVCVRSLQCRCGSGRLLPEEDSVLHAPGESSKSLQHQPGKRRAQPDQDCGLRERPQPPHPAGPSLRTRHRPQQRGRGTKPCILMYSVFISAWWLANCCNI